MFFELISKRRLHLLKPILRYKARTFTFIFPERCITATLIHYISQFILLMFHLYSLKNIQKEDKLYSVLDV